MSTKKVVQQTKKKVEAKVELSSEEESSEEQQVVPTTTKTTKAPAKKDDDSEVSQVETEKKAPVTKTPAKKVEEDDEDEDDDDEESEKKPNGNGKTNGKTNGKNTTVVKQTPKKEETEEDDDDDDDDEEEEVKPPTTKKTQPPAKTAQKKKTETKEDSDSESDEIHVVPPPAETKKTTQKDVALKRKREPEKEEKNTKKPKLENGGGSVVKVRLGNLSFDLDGQEDEIRKEFESCGEISEVEMIKRNDGTFAGVVIISFDSQEAANKALEKYDQEFYGRKMNLSLAKDEQRGKGKSRTPSQKSEGCTTVFIGNLSYNVTEDEVRELFSSCGNVTQIRWPKGDFTGIGWVEFDDTSATDEAIKLNGTKFCGRDLRVDYAAPRKERF